MSLLIDTIQKEKIRIEYMLDDYTSILNTLPKGSLHEVHRGGKSYCYLKYRDGNKIVSKYIKNDQVQEYSDLIAKRKHIESMIKSLEEELKIANKALEGIL